MNKYIEKMEREYARYVISLAYNQAFEAGMLPHTDLGYAVSILGLGPSLTGSFTGWHRDAAVVDVTYLNEHIAVGWLLRSHGRVRLVDFSSMSPSILEVRSCVATKLLGRTRKNLARDVFDHLQQSRRGVVLE